MIAKCESYKVPNSFNRSANTIPRMSNQTVRLSSLSIASHLSLFGSILIVSFTRYAHTIPP